MNLDDTVTSTEDLPGMWEESDLSGGEADAADAEIEPKGVSPEDVQRMVQPQEVSQEDVLLMVRKQADLLMMGYALELTGKHVYGGTVPAKERARRRARNKVARASRRINRSRRRS